MKILILESTKQIMEKQEIIYLISDRLHKITDNADKYSEKKIKLSSLRRQHTRLINDLYSLII